MTIAVTNKKAFPLGGSCQCGKIALTDEGFVNLFKVNITMLRVYPSSVKIKDFDTFPRGGRLF